MRTVPAGAEAEAAAARGRGGSRSEAPRSRPRRPLHRLSEQQRHLAEEFAGLAEARVSPSIRTLASPSRMTKKLLPRAPDGEPSCLARSASLTWCAIVSSSGAQVGEQREPCEAVGVNHAGGILISAVLPSHGSNPRDRVLLHMKHQSGNRRSFRLRDWFRSFLVRMQLGTIDPGTVLGADGEARVDPLGSTRERTARPRGRVPSRPRPPGPFGGAD